MVGGERVTIFAMRQMPANNNDLAYDYPFVVDPGRHSDGQIPILVGSAGELGEVVRGYGDGLEEDLLGCLVEFASDQGRRQHDLMTLSANESIKGRDDVEDGWRHARRDD
jgi:hypothetical protein